MLAPFVLKAILTYLETFRKTFGRLHVLFAFIVDLHHGDLLSTAEFTQDKHS